MISGNTCFQDLEGVPLAEGLWNASWLLYVLLIPLILYAAVSTIERFPAIWLSKVVYSSKYAATAYRNRSVGRQLGHTLLFIISLISLATFAYYVELHFQLYFFSLNGIKLWFFNLGIFSAALILRFLVILLLGEITGTKDAFAEYEFNISQFYKFLSVPLLLINFFIPYFESIPDIILVFLALAFLASLFIIRSLRLLSIFIRRGFSLFYFILYLCALEFTPILVFIKYLSGAV